MRVAWLIAVSLWAFTALLSASSSAETSEWDTVIQGMDLVVPSDQTAVFDLVLEDSEGTVLARAEGMADAQFKLFRYTDPYRYRDDVLVVDGHLLLLDEAHGAERPRAIAFRDIQDKPLFYVLAGTFLDLLETHRVSDAEETDDGSVVLSLEETGGHVVFENVTITVWTDGDSFRPSRARLHDLEDDVFWETAYAYSDPPLGGDLGLTIPSEVAVSLEKDDETTRFVLRLSNLRAGPGGQIGHTAIHGIE